MLNIRILGNQKEPTMLQKGMEIHDFQYRTKDAEVFEAGKLLVEEFVSNLGFTPADDEYHVIDDPMQITLGEYDDTGKFPGLNLLAYNLEQLGFFGKSANYRVAEYNPSFARDFNRAVSTDENINDDGSINWNFVDADLYGSEHRPNDDSEYMSLFDSLAIQYDLANGVIA